MNKILFILLAILIFSCQKTTNPSSSGQSDVVYLWLAAVKDSYVSSKTPDYSNPELPWLVCSHDNPNGDQRVYIKFFMPQLPTGTIVEKAYINLYEDSQTAQPGNDKIDVARVQNPWDHQTITWNNQPNPLGPLMETGIGLYTEHNIWRGTSDISSYVQEHLDNPSTNHGWMLNNSATYGFIRSFMSMNATNARTAQELNNGPRLLLKIKTPQAISISDIGVDMSIFGDNGEFPDMYGFGNSFRVYYARFGGDSWPVDWDVKTED